MVVLKFLIFLDVKLFSNLNNICFFNICLILYLSILLVIFCNFFGEEFFIKILNIILIILFFFKF